MVTLTSPPPLFVQQARWLYRTALPSYRLGIHQPTTHLGKGCTFQAQSIPAVRRPSYAVRGGTDLPPAARAAVHRCRAAID